jgi:hypothetical protein
VKKIPFVVIKHLGFRVLTIKKKNFGSFFLNKKKTFSFLKTKSFYNNKTRISDFFYEDACKVTIKPPTSHYSEGENHLTKNRSFPNNLENLSEKYMIIIISQNFNSHNIFII